MKRKKIYLIALAVVCAIFGVKYLFSLRNIEVVSGSENFEKNPGWNDIIAEEINKAGIVLNIDGTDVDIEKDDVFIDEDLNLMIKSDCLRPFFSCAVNYNDENNVVLAKSNTKVLVTVGSLMAIVDGAERNMMVEPVYINNSIYVPLRDMCEYFSYDFDWDYQNFKAVLGNTHPDEKIYPYAYDYRVENKGIKAKNQADYGTCWAFASLTALETSLMPRFHYDFSEDNMTMHNGYNLTPSDGGEYLMSMAYLTAWKGPVLENEDPYGDGVSPSDLTPALHVQEIQIIESKNFDAIKKAVFLYGGVQSSLYMSIWDADGNSSSTYNSESASYCYIGPEKANHDVVIVGWDDSYPASSFATQPEGDGAFLCVNSWGDKFGQHGYFYVSYYDSDIGVHNLVYTGIEKPDNYDNIYQTDLCGWVGQIGYGRDSAYFANVYEAQNDEILKSVGFYATGSETSYEVYLVDDYTDCTSFNRKELVAKGSFSNAGFYTVKLDYDKMLYKGKKYSVVVKITTPGSVHPIAIEYQADETTKTADISDGEGYISLNGNNWEHVETTQNCNVCLKMYTDNLQKKGTKE